MTTQKEAFLSGEGDAYFQRNAGRIAAHDPVIDGLLHLSVTPMAVAEVGCGEGARLRNISLRFGSAAYGFDPSERAINAASLHSPGLTFAVGTADAINLPADSVDVLIFGFCLYLTDPIDHFKIAAEADRVLRNGGFLCIHDFLPSSPHKNPYKHAEGLHSHKMDFGRMFTWHPSYRLIHRIYGESVSPYTRSPDETWVCDFMLKQSDGAFPIRST